MNLEEVKMSQFLDRLKAHLAADPYWMHVLASGNRADRRRLDRAITKLITTIPHVVVEGTMPREVRRKLARGPLGKTQPSDLRLPN